MKHIFITSATCLACITISSALYAAEAPASPNYSTYLTGDWNGKRSMLSAKGVDISASYTQDILSNIDGGRKRGTVGLSAAEAGIALDGEKLYHVKGSRMFFNFLGTAGGSPRSLSGSWQKPDNNEILQRGPHSGQQHTLSLYQAWVEQDLLNDKASLKAGLYDLNSEFYVTDTSRIFLGKTYHTGLEFEQTGKNGPSVYPITAPAIRAKVTPIENVYVQFALLDEVAGVPNHPYGVQFHLEPEDGALTVAEIGYKSDSYGHYAIGGWHYTGGFSDLFDTDASGNPITRHGNQGAYILAEKQIIPRLNGFARLGFSDSDVNSADYAWSAGLVYDQPIPSRKDSQLGFGISSARNSDKWMQKEAEAGSPQHWTETAFELTYRDKPTPWLAVQPNIQYIVNPNTDPAVQNTWLIGARLVVNF